MATVASLPLFLFTLPAGILTDKVNRQKFVCRINVCLASVASGLAVLGLLHLLNSYTILASVFLVGVGFAFNAPAWASIVPQIVSDAELPSATTLGGLQLNISGIIGPVLGGLLVPLVGVNFVFAVNGACFLLVLLAVRQWKQPTPQTTLGSESFFQSLAPVIRYMRNAPRLQVVLARNFLFALFVSVIPALMPTVGLKVLHLGSSQLGFLFTSMGAGSVFGAVFIISWLRARFSSDFVAFTANLLIVLAFVLMAFVRQAEAFFIVAAFAGVGWTLSASELWVAAQRAMPNWALGRMSATVIMISQGAMAFGGFIWSCAAALAGPVYTLLGASVLFLVSLLLSSRLSINVKADFEQKISGALTEELIAA